MQELVHCIRAHKKKKDFQSTVDFQGGPETYKLEKTLPMGRNLVNIHILWEEKQTEEYMWIIGQYGIV